MVYLMEGEWEVRRYRILKYELRHTNEIYLLMIQKRKEGSTQIVIHNFILRRQIQSGYNVYIKCKCSNSAKDCNGPIPQEEGEGEENKIQPCLQIRIRQAVVLHASVDSDSEEGHDSVHGDICCAPIRRMRD